MKNQENARDNYPFYQSLIEAGFPSIAEDELDSRLNINDYVIENKTATYFIRVKGDSMQGAGIFNEDILVVDRSKTPSCGKIIIACLNGEFTVKRLRIKNKVVFLCPENPKYKPIRVTNECDFEIFGVVTYNIHKPL